VERAVGKSRRIDLKKPGPLPAQVLDYNNFNMGVILLKIDVEKMTAEISLMENSLYIVKDGYLTKVTPRKFGEDTFIWKDGRIHDVIRSQRTRLNGQEEI
jgi:hypothetical protein